MSNASICDTSGNLLFFTNGEEVVDRNGNIMPNGDSLSYTDYYQLLMQYGVGPWYPQSVLVLPYPNNPGIYCIFHLRTVLGSGLYSQQGIVTGLMMSLVDMSLNNGLGDVTVKNQLLLSDTVQFGLFATRHGNGRDWWILLPTYQESSFYKILLNPEGVTVNPPVTSGSFNGLNQISSYFVPDGSKFLYLIGYTWDTYKILRFDFDRCQGTYTPNGFISLQDSSAAWSVIASPNSQLGYVIDDKYIYQFDLNAPDMGSTLMKVASHDGYYTGGFYTNFSFSHLGPDNRIYVAAGSADVMHYIANPNVPGPACQVVQHQIPLLSHNYRGAFPNIPNFKLGAWVGSPCDILSGTTEHSSPPPAAVLAVAPNPATSEVSFSFKHLPTGTDIMLVISDMMGRILMQYPIKPYQQSLSADISHLSAGFYTACLTHCTGSQIRTKFVVK